MINLLSIWNLCTLETFVHIFSVTALVFSLRRLFNQIDMHNKALLKIKNTINDLGTWHSENWNRISHLEVKVSKINSCKGCTPKKKASK